MNEPLDHALQMANERTKIWFTDGINIEAAVSMSESNQTLGGCFEQATGLDSSIYGFLHEEHGRTFVFLPYTLISTVTQMTQASILYFKYVSSNIFRS